MATINYAAREINVKIVYYGPALSGKTTNLQIIHKKTPQISKSDMVSLATEADRTLFFDFLPIDLGKIRGFTTKIQLYTVPGQVYYNATRKLVLRGVDGIVFVADSSAQKMRENIESFTNMEQNLAEYGYNLDAVPVVLQFNKRDVDDALPCAELNRILNRYNLKWNEAVARTGVGVFETLKFIGKEVIDILNRKYATPQQTQGITTPPTYTPPTQMPEQKTQQYVAPQQTPPFTVASTQTAFTPQPTEPVQQVKPQSNNFDSAFLDLEEIQPTPIPQNTQREIYLGLEPPFAEGTIPSAPQQEQPFEMNIELDSYLDLDTVSENSQQTPPHNTDVLDFDDPFFTTEQHSQMSHAKTVQMPAVSSTETPVFNNTIEDSFFDTSFQQNIEDSAYNTSAFGNTQASAPTAIPQQNSTSPATIPYDQDVFSQNIPDSTTNTSPVTQSQEDESHLFFTTVETNKSKIKKKPINPKFKKNFLDNLFNKR